MKSCLTVLKSIISLVVLLVFLTASLAGVAAAAFGTVYLAGIDSQLAGLAVFAFYFVIGLGTMIGIDECHS